MEFFPSPSKNSNKTENIAMSRPGSSSAAGKKKAKKKVRKSRSTNFRPQKLSNAFSTWSVFWSETKNSILKLNPPLHACFCPMLSSSSPFYFSSSSYPILASLTPATFSSSSAPQRQLNEMAISPITTTVGIVLLSFFRPSS